MKTAIQKMRRLRTIPVTQTMGPYSQTSSSTRGRERQREAWGVIVLLCVSLVGGLLVGGLAGCQSGANVSDENLTTVDIATLRSWLGEAKKKHLVVVDVRQAEAYEAGHIPGAIHMTLPQIRANEPRLAHAKTIVVYGSTWTDPLTPAAVKRLLALGYTDVVGYRGGWEDWSSQTSVAPMP